MVSKVTQTPIIYEYSPIVKPLDITGLVLLISVVLSSTDLISYSGEGWHLTVRSGCM